MHLIFIVICVIGVIGSEEDGPENKYVDMLPEAEKQHFLDKIARRIFEEVTSKNVANVSDVEITEDKLKKHSEYVQKIFKEESDNWRNISDNFNETFRTKESDDDPVKIGTLNKNEEKVQIDLTLHSNKRIKRKDNPLELMSTEIPVQVVNDDEIITTKNNKTSNVVSNLTVTSHELNSTLENITEKKDKQDIQVRNFRKFVERSESDVESTTVVIQRTESENINDEWQETTSDAITSTETTNIEFSVTESSTFFDETKTTTLSDLKEERTDIRNTNETYGSFTNNEENYTRGNKTILLESNTSTATEETNIDMIEKKNDPLQSNVTDNVETIVVTEEKQNESKKHLKTDLLTSPEPKKLTESTTNFVQEMSVQATDVSNPADTTTVMSLEMLSTRETTASTTKPIKSLENISTDAEVTNKNNVIDTNHLIDKLKNVLRDTLRLRIKSDDESNEVKEISTERGDEKKNSKEYSVYEINGDRPPFAQEQQDREQPYHVPIYNFAPNNAYYNPYNRLGPNYEDKHEDTKEITENFEMNPKVENIDGSKAFGSEHYFDLSELRATDDSDRKFTFAHRKSQNGMQKRKNKVAKLELPIVNRKPKYTEIYLNPDDYLDFDYYYGRMDGSLPGPTKLRKGYTSESDMSNDDYERSNQTESTLKNHLAFVRHMLYKNGRFGYVPSTAEKIKTENDTNYSDTVINYWPRPVIRMRNNDDYIIIIPKNSKNVIRALKKPRDIDLDYYFHLINDNDSYKGIRKRSLTEQQWEKKKKKIQSKPVPGQVYRPTYDFYNNYAYFEDQVKTSNNVLFRLKQFGKFKEGLDNRYDLWKAMFRVPFKTYNTNLKLIKNLTEGGWLTRAEENQLRRIIINLKFKNNRMFGISRNPKVNKNWNENSTISRMSNDNLRKGNDIPFIIIMNSKYPKNKKKVDNLAKHVPKYKYGNVLRKNMLLNYITRRVPLPLDKLLAYFNTIKSIQDISNPISSITVDQIKTSNNVLFRLHKFGKFKEGLDRKKDLMKAINEVPDDVYVTIRLMIIDMTKGRQFLTKAEARKLIVILLNMKKKRYSYFGLSEKLRKLYDRISKIDSEETVSVDEILKEIDLNFATQVSTNEKKQKQLDTNIKESDNVAEEVDADVRDNIKHRRFTSIELKKIKELNELMNIPEKPTPDLHLDQIETAKLALFRLFQFGKFEEGLDIPKQLHKAIKEVPGEVIESIIDILYDMEDNNRLKEKERIRLEGILYRIKDKNYKYFNLLNWSPANKTKKIKVKPLRSTKTMDLIENGSDNKGTKSAISYIIEALKSLLKNKKQNEDNKEKTEALDDKKGNNDEPKNIEISELISEQVFNANFGILRNMIDNSDRALIQYDWLGTVVDIRSAIKKLDYLSNELQNEVYVHPSDLELLKYTIYLHKKAKSYYDNAIKGETKKEGFLKENSDDSLKLYSKPVDRKRLLPKSNRNTGGKIANPISFINKNFFYMRLKPKREAEIGYDLTKIKDFLSELQFGLSDLHTAIKHVAMITKLEDQRWFENIKELYLESSRRKRTTEVLLHIFTARLFALIEESCAKGLERDFLYYVRKNKIEVERTLQEFVFILKLLDEIKKMKD